VHAPPLRERRMDIPGLVRFMLQRGEKRLHGGHSFSVDPEVEEMLMAYDWPGNVREMENVVDRALILADDGHITTADLPIQITRLPAGASKSPAVTVEPGGTLREQVRKFEVALICQAIAEADGDRRAASQKLGIGLSSLYRKLEEFEVLGLMDDGPAVRSETRSG
jgi:two-component system response regulator AtoC